MVISEIIEKLQECLKIHGDLEVQSRNWAGDFDNLSYDELVVSRDGNYQNVCLKIK